MPGDVANETYCQSMIDRAVQECGKLDILVNNAAMQRTHESIDEISSEEWDQTFRTNIHSMFYLSIGGSAAYAVGRSHRQHGIDQLQKSVS